MAQVSFEKAFGSVIPKTKSQLVFGDTRDVIALQPKKPPTVGEQLKKIETLPQPLKTLASPVTTGALAGTLGLLTGTGPVSAAIIGTSIPVAAGVVQSSPTVDVAVTKRLKDPVGAGKSLGKAAESIITGVGKAATAVGKGVGKAVEFTKENPLLVGGGAVAATLGAGAVALSKSVALS